MERSSTRRYLNMLLGAHVDRGAALGQAAVIQADVVQIFLSGPRTWAAPKPRGDEDELLRSGLAIYVHAPYLVNPASLNKDVRRNSRQSIIDQATAAARIGARGLVVHGGHPTGEGTLQDGIAGWVEVLSGVDLPVKLLIENTAGGNSAVARRFDAFAMLYSTLVESGHNIGICLDTCHAHAGGESLVDACAKLQAFAGSIDLIHANDSKDPFGSGRDRHENLGRGACGLEAIRMVVAEAKCPAVVETPGGAELMRDDVAALRGTLT